MNRDALKFTDLDGFLISLKEMGLNGEVTDLLYEDGLLPFGTAYIIPTHLLPEQFDLDAIDQFGGTITQIKKVNYLGIEEYDPDYMIFPLSMVAYVEVEPTEPTILVPSTTDVNWTTGEMVFVINLIDGGGKEFYLTPSGGLAGLADQSEEEPQTYKTYKQVKKQVDLMSQKYPKTCRVYLTDYREFEARRKKLLENPDA